MTDMVTADQQARLAALAAARRPRPPRPRTEPPVTPVASRRGRRRPAAGARVVTASVGLAATFGLVGAMGLSRRADVQPLPTVAEQPPPNAVTVVGGSTLDPIVLQARPLVSANAPLTATPAARTHGSR
jgi:hypothetical protein